MRMIPIRDVNLAVEIVGRGEPLVLMHGGPGADQWSLLPFRELADQFTLVFYDHRCNGRSTGAVETFTWENLTADPEALREHLGFERWAVLGHSFGGHVALEYALRYPERVSHLVLLNSGGDAWWPREHAAQLLARRGYSPKLVRLVRRFFNGQIEPGQMMPALLRMPYFSRRGPRLWWLMLRDLAAGEWRSRPRGEALVEAGRHLLAGWSVMDRLGEISVPTLVIAGRDDFLFPPEHQGQLALAIPGAQLRIVEHAAHNPHSEQSVEVIAAVEEFLVGSAVQATAAAAPGSVAAPRPADAAPGA